MRRLKAEMEKNAELKETLKSLREDKTLSSASQAEMPRLQHQIVDNVAGASSSPLKLSSLL